MDADREKGHIQDISDYAREKQNGRQKQKYSRWIQLVGSPNEGLGITESLATFQMKL